MRANGYLTQLEDGWVMPDMPFTLEGYQPGRRAAPEYGADTDALLKQVGPSDEEILALRIDGVVFQLSPDRVTSSTPPRFGSGQLGVFAPALRRAGSNLSARRTVGKPRALASAKIANAGS